MCLQLDDTPSKRTPAARPAVTTVVRRAEPAPEPRAVAKVRVLRARRHKKRPAPAPSYATTAALTALVRRFEDATLPREEWTHAAHLLVALVYARRHGPGEAIGALRAAIQRYNVATAPPEKKTGYHETITLGWFHLVRHFLDVFDDGRSLPALADALVARYASKDALFEHWSRERLLSPEARAGWVEPDLEPLPPLEPFNRRDRNFLRALDARAEKALPAAAAVVVTIARPTALAGQSA